MYQALYRKWRPRTFDDVVGQEHITETLKRQLVTGRLSHAYLFVGTRGTGKTTCAKILSRAVNCQHPVNGNPCNECPSCRGIESGGILDVEELDAASNNGVDNIRALRDEAVFTPAAVKKRVYIVDEVHMLSTAAFNALLKILEEPPEHLIFILATTELNKVPATILSRCQRYTFKRLTPEQIASRLRYVAEKEALKLTEGASLLLGRLAGGAMRDGLSLLDQCSGADCIDEERVLSAVGLTGTEETKKLLAAVLEENPAAAMEQIDRLYYEGRDLGAALEELLRLCRDVVMMRMANEGGAGLLSGGYEPAELKRLETLAPPSVYMYYIETLQSAISELPRSFDRRITAELCLLRLCDAGQGDSQTALRARVERLEQKLAGYNGPAAVPAASRQEGYEPEAPLPEEEPPLPPEPSRPESVPPETKSAERTAPRPAVDEASLWREILAEVQPAVDIAVYTFLGDSVHAVGVIRDRCLTVEAKNRIALNMIDTTEVKTALKAAAETVTGQPVSVRVT